MIFGGLERLIRFLYFIFHLPEFRIRLLDDGLYRQEAGDGGGGQPQRPQYLALAKVGFCVRIPALGAAIGDQCARVARSWIWSNILLETVVAVC